MLVRSGCVFSSKAMLWPAALVAAAATVSLAADARNESAPATAIVSTRSRWHQQQQLALFKDERQLYSVNRVIGRGGFGQVHEGRDKQSLAPVAIKRVDKQTTTRDKFLQEVSILRAVGGCANVVGLCGAFETTDAYVLVTELIQGEELFDHLVTKGVPAEERAQAMLSEITRALEYLHAHGVVHGDLKPENILLTADSQSVRLIDFGQSFREHITSERSRCLGSGVATIAYAAPEVITAQVTSSAIDMWGLGVVLFIVLCGFHPFDPENDASDKEMAQRIATGAFDSTSAEWRALSPAARDLVERLLQVDPSQRISAAEVLAHEWLQQEN